MKIIECIFLFLALSLHSVEANEIIRITYSTLSRRMEENPRPFQHVGILEIDNDTSIYGEESTRQRKDNDYIPMDNVCKDFKKQKMFFRGKIGFEKVVTSEDLPDFQWEMLEGDTVVCDYHCQKARTTFRGRTWVVWYSLDLPYSDGPWKLSGLPGLILKATDMKGDFSFSAYKIETEQEFKNTFSTKGMAMMTPQKYTQKFLDCYDEMNHREYNITIGGKPYKPESRTPCLMEYFDGIKK